MKTQFLTLSFLLAFVSITNAQVTNINSNKSLEVLFRLDATKGIYKAGDGTIWVTDATIAGTFQLSAIIKYETGGNVLNGKLIFPGTTYATGTELYITDGTVAGTALLKDIYPGSTGSAPDDDFVLFNDFIYFSAKTEAEGRELWRSDGTPGGTTLVKDIIPGPGQSALAGGMNIYSTGTFLLLTPREADAGYEIWKSDGTAAGTNLLKDINPGTASSDVTAFSGLGNLTLFLAKDPLHGLELWKTDGTEAGTQLVKDIRTGPKESMNYFNLFTWNNKGYFIANDGLTGAEMWSTDGTTANTFLVKDIEEGSFGGFEITTLGDAIKLPNKFIFTAYNQHFDVELWESDGTSNGTKLFKEIGAGLESGLLYLLPPYDITSSGVQQLFQGNKFFFLSIMISDGSSLWVSDGTVNGTVKIKNFDAGEIGGGVDYISAIYTPQELYFSTNDKLWKSNGTGVGTTMIADIKPSPGNIEVKFTPFLINNKLVFEGTDGDVAAHRDLFSLDGDVILPVKLTEFTARLKDSDGLLQWATAQEINSKDVVIERSYSGLQFAEVGTVPAVGFSTNKTSYSFTDRSIDFKNNRVYYRLQMNDRDGKQTTSKIIALPLNGNNAWDIKVMALNRSVQVKVNGGLHPVQLQVYDISGRLVASSRINAGNDVANISMSSFTPGVYFIQALQNNQRKTVQFVNS